MVGMAAVGSFPGSKGQVSIEFMLIFILFIAVLSMAVVFMAQNTQVVQASTAELEAQQALSLIKNKLETAFLEGDGFSSGFIVPEKIYGSDYSLTLDSMFVVIRVSNQTYSTSILADGITGSLKKGLNSVRNDKGQLVIS